MINFSEHNDLLQRKQELLKEQELCIDNRNIAKKHFAEINFHHDLQRLGEICESISLKGAKGDRKLLNLIIESQELMKKQAMDINKLANEIDRDYFAKERNCDDELQLVQRQLRMLNS